MNLKQRTLTILLAILILTGLTVPATAQNHPFTDVNTGWYAGYVQFMYENGVMGGVGSNRFDPRGNFTRASVTATLFRVMNQRVATDTDSRENDFNDVTTGWYAPYVTWAYHTKLVTGISDTRFAPNRDITRQEMATILFRLAQSITDYNVPPEYTLDQFADNQQVAEWATAAMTWASYRGIITGRPGPLLAPGDNLTRAEAAAVLMRFINLIHHRDPGDDSPLPAPPDNPDNGTPGGNLPGNNNPPGGNQPGNNNPPGGSQPMTVRVPSDLLVLGQNMQLQVTGGVGPFSFEITSAFTLQRDPNGEWRNQIAEVATVSQTGLVRPLRAGFVNILVTDEGNPNPATGMYFAELRVAAGQGARHTYALHELTPHRAFAHSNLGAILYIQTNNPNPDGFQMTGGSMLHTPNFRDVRFTGNDGIRVRSVDRGYLTRIQHHTVGEQTMELWEAFSGYEEQLSFAAWSGPRGQNMLPLFGYRVATITVRAYNETDEIDRWTERVIAEQTNPNLSVHENISRVVAYIMANYEYPPFTYETGYLTDHFLRFHGPWWEHGMLSSLTGPDLVHRVALSLGVAPANIVRGDLVTNLPIHHAFIQITHDGVTELYLPTPWAPPTDPATIPMIDFSRF